MTDHCNYTVEVRERGRRLSLERIVDPFVCTRVAPKGWRAAWDVLRGRYEVEVLVNGDRERVEQVMELNPDYIGPAGSASREAWNAQLHGALSRLASDEQREDS